MVGVLRLIVFEALEFFLLCANALGAEPELLSSTTPISNVADLDRVTPITREFRNLRGAVVFVGETLHNDVVRYCRAPSRFSGLGPLRGKA